VKGLDKKLDVQTREIDGLKQEVRGLQNKLHDFTANICSEVDSMSRQLTGFVVKKIGEQFDSLSDKLSSRYSEMTDKLQDLTDQMASSNKDLSNMLDQLEIWMSQRFGVQHNQVTERRL